MLDELAYKFLTRTPNEVLQFWFSIKLPAVDIPKLLSTLRIAPEDVRFQQSKILEEWDFNRNNGTTVHALIEEHIKYGKVPTPDNPNYRAFNNGYLKYRKENSHLVNWHAEVRIYWARGHFKGTVDAIAYDIMLKEWVVVDWKCVKAIYTASFTPGVKGVAPFNEYPDCNHIHYSFQTGLYAYVLSKFYYELFGTIKKRFLVQILRDGTGYRVYPCHPLHKEVKAVARHRIDDELQCDDLLLRQLRTALPYVPWHSPQPQVYIGRDAQRTCIIAVQNLFEVKFSDRATSLMFNNTDTALALQRVTRWFERKV